MIFIAVYIAICQVAKQL